jgi:hypothetical protein
MNRKETPRARVIEGSFEIKALLISFAVGDISWQAGQPHFVRRREAKRFVQRAAVRAGVQDHSANLIGRAPLEGDLHQGASHALAAMHRLGIDIENVGAPRAGYGHVGRRASRYVGRRASGHVGRPIHQPEAQSSSDRRIRREGEPSEILTGFHLSLKPRPKAGAHPVKRILVPIAHIPKHGSPVTDDRIEVRPFERSGTNSHSFDDKSDAALTPAGKSMPRD